MASTERVQGIFLTCVCSVYLIAFVSLFIQIPGLYGNNGILPVRLALKSEVKTIRDAFNIQPTLLHFLPRIGIEDVELGFNIICLAGIVLSLCGYLCVWFRNTWTFALLWLFYQSLFQVGQTFLWFQWDTLLLELGFLVIFVAPLKLPFVDAAKLTKHGRSVAFWLVRWLTFRLMFCSGVVKLNSQCPTWWGLTATTYHYESQCIPTPLAWYAHQAPLWFHRASTGFVFVIQIVTTIIFFSPCRTHKIASFFIQSFLMVAILLTGNYNFFNWVSIVMCISLLDDKFLAWCFKSTAQDNQKDSPKTSKSFKISRLLSFLLTTVRLIVHLVVLGTVIYVARHYFSIRFLFDPLRIASDINFSLEDFHIFLRQFMPITIWVASASLAFVIISSAYKSLVYEKDYKRGTFNLLYTFFFGLFALVIFCTTLVPYTDVERDTQNKLPRSFIRWHQNTHIFNIFNGYGLFRSMTGVGGRPEVIVEGSDAPDGGWQEFNFLYKPGDVNRRPPVVAPHQPRLDWQLWFAALGSYNHNPWFYHLVYRILNHEKDVLALMDGGPFEDAAPKYVRARLYHYHYTSYNESTGSWWKRELKREYLPVLSLEDEHMMSYIKNIKLDVVYDEDAQKIDTRTLGHYFFRYLHTIAQPKHGFEICSLFLLLGIIIPCINGKVKEKVKEKERRSCSPSAGGGKEPLVKPGVVNQKNGKQL